MHFSLKEFDLNLMKNNPRILIIGKQQREKTILVDHIARFLVNSRNKTNVTIICPRERKEQIYTPKWHSADILDGVSGSYVKHYLHKADISKQQRDEPTMLLVLDEAIDIQMEKTEHINGLIGDIFVYTLRLRMSLIVSEQSCINVLHKYIETFDYIFLFRENFVINKANIWSTFCESFVSFNQFNDLFEKHSKNYSCLVIDKTIQAAQKNGTKRFYWFKIETCSEDSEMDNSEMEELESDGSGTEEILEDSSNLDSELDDGNSCSPTLLSPMSSLINSLCCLTSCSTDCSTDDDDDNNNDAEYLTEIKNIQNKNTTYILREPTLYDSYPRNSWRDNYIEKISERHNKSPKNKTPLQINSPNSESFLKIEYFDVNHEVSLVTSDLQNSKTIKTVQTICDHILSAKKLKFETDQNSGGKLKAINLLV